MEVLDLFSAAAGGWSLGMHRAGFCTVAACEWIDWRRAVYLQNNPGVRMYDDVRTLTGEQLLRDLGFLPSIVVGSPPCQDISPANTKGKGVEGERSSLYFEAVRIIGEIRDLGRERGESAARWFALENSHNLRTKGADAVLSALEELGYTCWSFVVRAGDVGANHERPRSWLVGCDLNQVADAGGRQQWEQPRRRLGASGASEAFDGLHDTARAADTHGVGWDERREGRRGGVNLSLSQDTLGPGRVCEHGIRWPWACHECDDAAYATYTDQTRSAAGQMEPSLRETSQPIIGRDDGWGGEVARSENDIHSAERSEVGLCEGDRRDALAWRSNWSLEDLADHIRLDDGLSAWVAQSRIAVGGPRGTSAASLIVEAFGDAVVPQIPEAIGRAILRTERALAAVYGRSAA